MARESCGDVANSSGCDLVTVVGESLPRVVPNVILAKREELIPMLMAAIQVFVSYTIGIAHKSVFLSNI